MYREIVQWRQIRRRLLEDGTPKKQVARETGISRRTLNRILAYEGPPGYGPRPPYYPKLDPYIPAIGRLLTEAASLVPASRMTIRDIVEHLRRDEGFAGSYDSVRNYIRNRERDDESAWERAYDLIIGLPKSRAIDFIRLLSHGDTPIGISARVRPFVREAACPCKSSVRLTREKRSSADIEWMRQVLQKEVGDDDLYSEFADVSDLGIILRHLRNGRLLDRNRAMVVLASRRKTPIRTICEASAKALSANTGINSTAMAPPDCLPRNRSRTAKSTTRDCGMPSSVCFTNRHPIMALIEQLGRCH